MLLVQGMFHVHVWTTPVEESSYLPALCRQCAKPDWSRSTLFSKICVALDTTESTIVCLHLWSAINKNISFLFFFVPRVRNQTEDVLPDVRLHHRLLHGFLHGLLHGLSCPSPPAKSPCCPSCKRFECLRL